MCSSRQFMTGLMVALLTAVAGCGGAAMDRCAVSGAIRGLEQKSGLISFVPEPGTDGPAVRAAFADGRYAFDSKLGPKPGRYVVLIWVTPDASKNSNTSGVPLDELKSRMTDYGEPRSLLVSVPKQAEAVLDLDLPSK